MSPSQSLQLEPVPSREVAAVWKDHAGAFLEPVIKGAKSRWQLGDPIGLCQDEEGQLWLIWDYETSQAAGALITQIIESGDEKALEILALAGRNMPRWLHLIAGLDSFARLHGCNVMRNYGRLGLQRALKAQGWRPALIVLERAL